MARKIKALLKSYKLLNEDFTQISNSMLINIKDPYAFKVYFYLCSKFEEEFSHCSISEISKDTDISLKKVKTCLSWLCDENYIEKVKYTVNGVVSNKYKVFYDSEENKDMYTCYVYTHKDMITGKVLYVGKGTGLRAYNLRDRNIKYLDYIYHIGRMNIKIDIVKEFDNSIDAYKYEEELTLKYKEIGEAEYNIVIGNPSL